MKIAIITLVALTVLSIGNTFGREQFFKNVEINDITHTITTPVCKGVNEKYLSQVKRYATTADFKGDLIEKIQYAMFINNKDEEILSVNYLNNKAIDLEIKLVSYLN